MKKLAFAVTILCIIFFGLLWWLQPPDAAECEARRQLLEQIIARDGWMNENCEKFVVLFYADAGYIVHPHGRGHAEEFAYTRVGSPFPYFFTFQSTIREHDEMLRKAATYPDQCERR